MDLFRRWVPAGAGWGLVIPFGVGSLIMIFYLRSSHSIIHLNFRGQVPRWALFADILKVGVPGLTNTSIAFGFGTAIVAMVGTNWGAQQYGRADPADLRAHMASGAALIF
jgi:Na+-driven multidrug efflux pump